MMKQALELSKKPHIVVATPGRLVDHLQSSAAVDFKRIKYLVLDEADRLLSGTFLDEIKVAMMIHGCCSCLQAIVPHVSPNRQTLLFSATMTKDLEVLKAASMRSSAFVFDANPTHTTVDTLRQTYIFLPVLMKELYLVHLLQQHSDVSVIVFTAKRKTCQYVWEFLKQLDMSATPLHSALSQHERLASIQRFKSSVARILVCTDVASRYKHHAETVTQYSLSSEVLISRKFNSSSTTTFPHHLPITCIVWGEQLVQDAAARQSLSSHNTMLSWYTALKRRSANNCNCMQRLRIRCWNSSLL